MSDDENLKCKYCGSTDVGPHETALLAAKCDGCGQVMRMWELDEVKN